ncbi:MAG TPA: V-type ATP synthase subunit K [Candidatus Faecaligallichristensenella faecipullorum]|nr:V-type ATP synthase subunit K [Candidatus Faecaligallichristensenella faecipullorum]
MEFGQILGLLGAALAVLMAGIGSARGVAIAGQASAGVCSENPNVFGQALVLELLPGTQGIYGFLIGFIVLQSMGILGGSGLVPMTTAQGLLMLVSCLPIAIVGLISAIFQGKVAASAIGLLGRRSDMGGKGILMTVMVETYAILALLASFLMVNAVL